MTNFQSYAILTDQKIGDLVEKIKGGEEFEITAVISTDSFGSIVRIDVPFMMKDMPATLSVEIAEKDNDLAGLRLTVNMTPREGVTVTIALNITVEKTAEEKIIRFASTGLSTYAGFDISGSLHRNQKTGATDTCVELKSPESEETMNYEVNFLYLVDDESLTFGNLEFKVNGIVSPIPAFLLTIKTILKHIYTFNEDENDSENWRELTEAETPEQKEWLEAGYFVSACPESEIDNIGMAMLKAPEGSLSSVVNVSGENVFFDFFYFNDAAQAKICFNAYENNAAFIRVSIKGNAIYYEFLNVVIEPNN